MYKKRNILTIVVILLVTIVLAGCFGTDKINEAELEQKANELLNSIENYYVNENLQGIADLLSDDFIYYEETTEGSIEADRQLFLSEVTEEHFKNYDIESFEINNRTIDVKSQTKIEVIGEGTETYIAPDTGEEFNQGPTETKFIFEKIDGKWLVTRFEVYYD